MEKGDCPFHQIEFYIQGNGQNPKVIPCWGLQKNFVMGRGGCMWPQKIYLKEKQYAFGGKRLKNPQIKGLF
ncbi:hypothetical protein [Persicitalea sp.]|uniref:hypothetical protein n=1 Tax=Persicitalea sp. TaxID=3100273 RepID=UPI00359477A8